MALHGVVISLDVLLELPYCTHGRAVVQADREAFEWKINGKPAMAAAHIVQSFRVSHAGVTFSLSPACRLRRCLGSAEGHGFEIGMLKFVIRTNSTCTTSSRVQNRCTLEYKRNTPVE